MYQEGFHIGQARIRIQNDRTAAFYIREAVERGVPEAQNLLGILYADGAGVPQDYVKAYAWYNVAVSKGWTFETEAESRDIIEAARENRDNVARRLTREAFSRTQSLSGDYWEAYVVPWQDPSSTPPPLTSIPTGN